MKQGLKRPIQTFLIQVLWVVLVFYNATRNSSDFGRWILWLLVMVGVITLVYKIARPNYIEVLNNKLIIHKGFFWTKSIDLDMIEKIDIRSGPFSSSKIILKDHTAIKYMNSQTDLKELKEFMGQFNIVVA